jgi:ribosomal protein S8
MINLVKNINLINIAAKNKKLSTTLTVNSQIKKTLNILVEYNLIEYQTLGPYKALITLKYKNYQPVIKSINFMGSRYKNNVTLTYLSRESNNKKALYIIQTSQGLKTVESAIHLKISGVLLFKITI